MKIEHAKIAFNQVGTPTSERYNDVYFSNDDGLAETHYVFIEGNKLLQQWQQAQADTFVIGETGFGTGLNFLLTLSLFAQFRERNPQHPLKYLFYISTEKYPLSKADMGLALNAWSSLTQFSQQLLNTYPTNVSGVHRLNFLESSVFLDLHYGDAQDSFANMHSYQDGLIDAWFLDGFAPSKNDSLWTPELFTQLARLSKLHTSFATFTAAGVVKRGLKEVGFEVEKTKGFGKKRDMLVGKFGLTNCISNESSDAKKRLFSTQHPAFYRASTFSDNADLSGNSPKHTVAVIGGGIAAMTMCIKLLQRGYSVDLFCADEALAGGASGNDQGGFYPQLNAQAGINTQVHVHSFLYASRFYKELLEAGYHFEHDWCGVLQLSFNDNLHKRHQKMLDNAWWPDNFIQHVNQTQASKIANLPLTHGGLFIKQGGWISPPSFVSACLTYCQTLYASQFSLHLNSRLVAYEKSENGCELQIMQQPATVLANAALKGEALKGEAYKQTPKKQSVPKRYHYRTCVLACGSHSVDTNQQKLPFRLTRGQVERVQASDISAQLNTVICHKGYMTPVNKSDSSAAHAIGSTYVKSDTNTEYRASEATLNIDMHINAMGEQHWLTSIGQSHLQAVDLLSPLSSILGYVENDDAVSSSSGISEIENAMTGNLGRAAVRCSTPDHLPLVGTEPDINAQQTLFAELYKAKPNHYYPIAQQHESVYMLTGLGSRGLTTTPLMAELLVSQISQQPLPMQNALLNALNPSRFLVRSLIRREAYLE